MAARRKRAPSTHGSDGVPCPICGHGRSAVLDTRTPGHYTRRRRECLACHERFTTHEISAHEHRSLDGEIDHILDGLNATIRAVSFLRTRPVP